MQHTHYDQYLGQTPVKDVEVYVHDSGMFLTHDYSCPVCREKHAVLSSGLMQPCWDCQEKGFVLVNNSSKLKESIMTNFSKLKSTIQEAFKEGIKVDPELPYKMGWLAVSTPKFSADIAVNSMEIITIQLKFEEKMPRLSAEHVEGGIQLSSYNSLGLLNSRVLLEPKAVYDMPLSLKVINDMEAVLYCIPKNLIDY